MTGQIESDAVTTEEAPSLGCVQFVDRPGFTELHLCSLQPHRKIHR